MSTERGWDPIGFTRLRLTLATGGRPWAVPVDYYRLLRAAFYRLVGSVSPELAAFLHAEGFRAESPAARWRGVRDRRAADRQALAPEHLEDIADDELETEEPFEQVADLPPTAEEQGTGGSLAAEGIMPDSQPSLEETSGRERYKLFAFSSLIGEGSLRQGRLVFEEDVHWFLATPLAFVADALLRAIRQAGAVRLGRIDLPVSGLQVLTEPPVGESVTCVLLSPLVVTAPDSAAGQRRYLTREDGIVVTEARLRTNLLAKHRALYGTEPADAEFRFAWAADSQAWPTPDRPTRLVRLSGSRQAVVRVRGSLGAVTLAGSAELLRLALHAGLGQHNASGMGFVLPEGEAGMVRG